MKLLIGSRSPCIERTLELLQRIPLSEQGQPVRVLAAAAEPAQLASGRAIVLAGEQSAACDAFLQRFAGGGILYLGATTGLAAKGVLRGLVVARDLDARHFAAFGVRHWSLEEHDFVRSHRPQVYSMVEISREGLAEITDAVMMYVRNWPAFYLVLNLDLVDPPLAPVRLQSPGGFTSRELLYVLQRLLLIPSLAGVELVVDAELNEHTAALVARIIAECAASLP